MKARKYSTSGARALGGVAVLLAANPAWAGDIGKVSFLVGQAQVERQGKLLPLHKDMAVETGDRIVTGTDGHVHLRMTDQGFIAVRPASALHLQAYDYQVERPAESKVKLHLESGVSRTVSGKAGEAARERYRFNTPVAAIGLRGTDYVVQAFAETTRVSVLEGAVAVSLYGAGCAMDGLAPCQGPLTRELQASTPHAYLEARARGGLPVIVPPENGKEAPNKVAPPRPEESSALSDRQITSTLAAGALEPVIPEPPPVIAWGRWSSVALPATPTVASQQTPERLIAFGNELFGLYGQSATPQLPTEGRVSLGYAQGEAYLRTGGGNAAVTLTPVNLSGGRLSLDFDRRQFSTNLNASVNANLYELYAQGAIQAQGQLVGDPARSNMNVAGVTTSQAREAGYLFDANVAPNQTLIGATRWKR